MNRGTIQNVRALLISTYDLGRQPFGLASPAAWLREAGVDVTCIDLSRQQLPEDAVRAAGFIAFFLPMHTATRLALPVIDRVRSLNAGAALCAYGLYASLNASLLRERGVTHIVAGEFEEALRDLAVSPDLDNPRESASRVDPRESAFRDDLGDSAFRDDPRESAFRDDPRGSAFRDDLGDSAFRDNPRESAFRDDPRGSTSRLEFRIPDRSTLPPLSRYATLQIGDERRVTGYTETSRGCKHRCRHCPIVPVYDGRFRIVPVATVMSDVRAQVEAGARHITFGDPDFFNGIGHATAVLEAFARQVPGVSYDVTIKVEHLVKQAHVLPLLRDTGCAFVTTAVESVDDAVLGRLEKGHTQSDFERVVALFRGIDLALSPTFVPFTPWTTLESYCELLRTIDRLELVDSVAPIQLAIRLLVTEGSRLLELPEIRAMCRRFDMRSLTYPWKHADPRVDALQERIAAAVGIRLKAPRREVFSHVWRLAHEAAGGGALPERRDVRPRTSVPYLNEPWYC
jgi:radical SAM superfamily enzyme YgiQ (UPF0313 family)